MGSRGFHVPLCSFCQVFCAPRIKTSQSPWTPLSKNRGELHQLPPWENSSSIQYWLYVEIKMLWISKMFVLRKRKRLLNPKAVCFVVNLSLIQPIESVTARKWLSFYWREESSKCICFGSAWLSVKFKLASLKIQVFISHIIQLWIQVGFTVLNLCNRVSGSETQRWAPNSPFILQPCGQNRSSWYGLIKQE